jgi:inorganic pyrophosphatase
MKLGKRWVENIPSSDDPDRWVPVVNEISAGSHCKYRLDKTTGQLELARALPHNVAFPANYGFVPHTRSSADDEETDVMVLSSEPILPLTIVRARMLGGFIETTTDQDEPEERLLAAAADDPNVEHLHDVVDIDGALREQIETFVRTYKQNQDVKVTFAGWFDREAALDRLRRGFKRAKKRPAR